MFLRLWRKVGLTYEYRAGIFPVLKARYMRDRLRAGVYNGHVHKLPPKTPKKITWPELASPFGNNEIWEGKGKGKGKRKGEGKEIIRNDFVQMDNQMRKSIEDLIQEID